MDVVERMVVNHQQRFFAVIAQKAANINAMIADIVDRRAKSRQSPHHIQQGTGAHLADLGRGDNLGQRRHSTDRPGAAGGQGEFNLGQFLKA